MSRADAATERILQRGQLLQGSDEGSPMFKIKNIFFTCTDHSHELSLLMECLDEGLNEGRPRNSLGALQATWNDNGVVFSLKSYCSN